MAKELKADRSNRQRPGITTWLPHQQEHGLGRQGAADLYRGDSWTTTSGDSEGYMVVCWEVKLEPGEYAVLFQIYHKESEGRDIGTIEVFTSSASTVASKLIKTRYFESQDWQREVLTFRIDEPVTVTLALYWNGKVPLWTGAVDLTCLPRRPFYNIAHMCNTSDYVQEAITKGANAIECDITVKDNDGVLSFEVYHGFAPPYPIRSMASTPLEEYLQFMNEVSDDLALIIFDCKKNEAVDYRRYGRELCNIIKRYLAPERCVMSIPEVEMVPFFKGMDNASFSAGKDISMVSTSPASEDPCLWLNVAEREEVTFLGMGIDAYAPFSPLRNWLAPFQCATSSRDRNHLVKKVYYWTLNAAVSMRKMLDYGVDGIIVNEPETLWRVLREEPYRTVYRLATPYDSQFMVHGWE